jgi:hypothetical protein
VLKTHGHLVSPDIEAAAQDAPGQLAEVADGGARVHVAAVPSGLLKLERSRSQHLHSALAQLPVQEQLAAAAELAAAGRVLGAEAALQRAAEAAGGTLKELEALSTEAVSAVLPAGSSLDVAQVRREAHVVREALCSLEDHSGWMVSRDDKLKVYYRHLKGTTVHSLKFRAVFDHPLEHLLALAHEFDLIPNWNKCAPAFLGERGGSRLGRQSDRGCKQRHAGCLLWYGLLRGCTLRMTLPPNPNPQVFPGGADAGGAVCV